MAEELMKSGDEVKASEEVKNADSKEMVVIDIKDDEKVTKSSNSNSNSNSEKVCRICLEYSSPQAMIIALGCNCRGELGFSHPRCASTWFSLRGNRECEICGKTAKNIHYSNRLVRRSLGIVMRGSSGVVREWREIEVEDEDEVDWRRCIVMSTLVISCIISLLIFHVYSTKH